MSQSSAAGYVIRAPLTSFSANEPVSAWRAYENRQNLLHLTDEFSQHRINWVSRDATGHGIEVSGNPDETAIWSCTYPHTWLAPNKPANLDLQVMGHDCYVRARLLPHTAPIQQSGQLAGNMATTAVFDTTLDVSSASPTTDSYLHIVSSFHLPTYEKGWMRPSGGEQEGSDGVTRKPSVCLMRLELQILAETPCRVYGVLLREFA